MVGAPVIQGSKLSGGDELGAAEWSLGPQGASSETGRRHGRFLGVVYMESGLGRAEPTETVHLGREPHPLCILLNSTGASLGATRRTLTHYGRR